MKEILRRTDMYIGHYKAVASADEFFSEPRKELDFPTQIEYKKQRYSLFATHIVSSDSQLANIKNRTQELNIKFNIKI
jgi:hypothetical protein